MYVVFWNMTIYNDALHRSDITLYCDFLTELKIITKLIFDKFCLVYKEHSHAIRWRLHLSYVLMLRLVSALPFLFPEFFGQDLKIFLRNSILLPNMMIIGFNRLNLLYTGKIYSFSPIELRRNKIWAN